ncbi:MAG: glycosyltransferase family 39 protein [Anaerolineae bacterium]|jgi:4-amino-4-deoxy-L-arabinose transferase-like glycosyltransferase
MADVRLAGDEGRDRIVTVAALAILLLGLVFRLAPLGRYVTPDEPAWVYRSIRFADALAARDWAAIPDTGHPGVTTMWLGAAGVAVRRLVTPVESAAHLDWLRNLAWLDPENGVAIHRLAFFLPVGRIAVALTTVVGLLMAYCLMVRCFGRRAGLLGLGLLTFDPFLVGHSGLLHTDALLTTFSLLAILAAFSGLRARRPAPWWALAGLFAGLALLTKTPALILFPFTFLLLAVHDGLAVIRGRHGPARLLGSVAWYLLFILVAGATFLALYAALWVDLQGALQMLTEITGQHVDTSLRATFFLGQMTYDPGPAYYPLVLLYRGSPVVLIGVGIGLVRLRRMPAGDRFRFLALLTFALLFGLGISLAAKKHDRYLLPAFPPLAVAAAVGLTGLLERGARRTRGAAARRPLPVLLQLLFLVPFALHPLTHYNLLAGGPWMAERLLPTGWGEEMGAAARWMERLPVADQLTVAAANVPSFAALFPGRTVSLDQASQADYVVPVSPPSGVWAERWSTWPVAHTATVGFVDQAVVLANPLPFRRASYLMQHVGPEDVVLLHADASLLRIYEGPGTVHSLAALASEADVAAWLAQHRPPDGAIWWVTTPEASPITAAHLRRQLTAIASSVQTDTVAGAAVVRFAPQQIDQGMGPPPFVAHFGGHLALVDGVILRDPVMPLDRVTLVLRWQALAPPPTDYQVVLSLRDAAGHVWSNTERPVLNRVDFPASAWAAEEWVDRTYELLLPAGAPPGRYVAEISLYDAATGAGLGAAAPDGAFRGTRVPVGEVIVAPPVRPPSLADLGIPRYRDRSAGPLKLLGFSLPPEQVLSGDHLTLRLFWRADAAPDADYRIRLRLVDAGEVGMTTVVPLSPYPTSRWRTGDQFESRHTIHALPDLAPSLYQLTLNVLGTGDAPLWDSDESLGQVEVLPRERSFDPPDSIPVPVDLAFGDRIQLLGYDLPRSRVAPGEALPLTLYWRADGYTDRSYTLFVHLLGEEGAIYGQVDRLPRGGSAPTTSWAAGQVIVDQVDLPVRTETPTGTYQIAVGFYDVLYGDRLPVSVADRPSGDERAFLPTEVEVEGDQP